MTSTAKNFAGQNLRGKSFKGQDLSGSDFSGADLRGADFTDAILRGVNFTRARTGLQNRWLLLKLIIALLLFSMSVFLSLFVNMWFLFAPILNSVSYASTVMENPIFNSDPSLYNTMIDNLTTSFVVIPLVVLIFEFMIFISIIWKGFGSISVWR